MATPGNEISLSGSAERADWERCGESEEVFFARGEVAKIVGIAIMVTIGNKGPLCHLVYNNDGGVKGGRGRLRLGF